MEFSFSCDRITIEHHTFGFFAAWKWAELSWSHWASGLKCESTCAIIIKRLDDVILLRFYLFSLAFDSTLLAFQVFIRWMIVFDGLRLYIGYFHYQLRWALAPSQAISRCWWFRFQPLPLMAIYFYGESYRSAAGPPAPSGAGPPATGRMAPARRFIRYACATQCLFLCFSSVCR